MAQTETKYLSKILPDDVGGLPRTVIFVFGNGAKTSLCLDDVSEETRERLALHGLSQKGGDATSSLQKARDFAGGYAATSQVLDNLRNGLWSSRAGSSTSDLVLAVADLLKISAEEAQSKVDKATDESLTAIRKHPAVKKFIADLQAARAKEAAKVAPKLSDLMASLGM